MPIETPHPLYEEAFPKWQRCRDAYDGEDAVKKGGEKYLPKADPGQTKNEYAAYLMRACYYEAVARTVDGFVGTIARKPHTIELKDKLEPLVQDITADGMGVLEFIKRLCSEILLQARCGVLVEFDDAKARPFLSYYQAEAITNWSDDWIVLFETVYEADPADPFKNKAIQQYRRLILEEGVYQVEIWRQANAGPVAGKWALYQTKRPTMRGKPLTEIPFIWLSSMGVTSRVEKPPLLGLVNIALSHYRSSADLEHGRHFTGLPTLYVTGMSSKEPIRVGAAAAIILSDPGAKAGYAEFNGQGLQSLETALETKEQKMAVLGAAVFANEKKGVEAADTARIRASGETSLLAGVVSSVEDALINAIAICGAWVGQAGNPVIELNREFVDTTIDPQTLAALVQAYQAGAVSLETFLYSLQQSDMLRPDTDIDEEATKVRADVKAQQAAAAALAAKTKPQPGANAKQQ